MDYKQAYDKFQIDQKRMDSITKIINSVMLERPTAYLVEVITITHGKKNSEAIKTEIANAELV